MGGGGAIPRYRCIIGRGAIAAAGHDDGFLAFMTSVSSTMSTTFSSVECSLDTGGAVTRDRSIVAHSAVTTFVSIIFLVTGGTSAKEESPTKTLRYRGAIGGKRSLV